MHRIMLPHPITEAAGETIDVLGDEAHHAARVKRLEPGGRIQLLDGHGAIADAEIAAIVKLGKRDGWALRSRIVGVTRHEPLRPALRVCTAAPKGPRLETLIDQLSQVGAAAWSPLQTTRSVVDPRDGKLDRLGRVALEAAKQCGRPWALTIEPGCRLADLLGPGVILADAAGDRYEPTGHADLTLLVGPEGGWTGDELDAARAAGARVVGFGVHVMRIETAAVVASGIVIDAERTHNGGTSS